MNIINGRRKANELPEYDAIVVGSGPNGLAAAVELARSGWSVAVFEAREKIGGGTRSEELTLPGFVHDVCSAIHPLGIGSPFFKTLPLEKYGVEWIYPEIALAHPFDDLPPAYLYRSFDQTAAALGPDGEAWRQLMEPFARRWDDLAADILAPLRLIPHHPLLMARFGLKALLSTRQLVNRQFKGPQAKALFAGMAAHSFIPLDRMPTASFGLVLGILAHAIGWPMARGGSAKITQAMAAYLTEMGGEIITGTPVQSLDELPPARAVLFDITPRQLLQIAGDRLPSRYRHSLEKYRYGPGIFKIDWALSGPIPWKDASCSRAGTVHLGGRYEELAQSERAPWDGKIAERPLVLVAQQSMFDPTRAPEGKHTGWAYCHIPSGSFVDMTERIEGQMERFAPGFRDLILARHTFTSPQLEAYNPNYVGGDINGGVQDLRQLFTRPTWRFWNPYAIPGKGLYLCSSSTPPGGGVHGMCGYYAARAVMDDFS